MSHTEVSPGMEYPSDESGETLDAHGVAKPVLKPATKQDNIKDSEHSQKKMTVTTCNQCKSIKEESNVDFPETCDECVAGRERISEQISKMHLNPQNDHTETGLSLESCFDIETGHGNNIVNNIVNRDYDGANYMPYSDEEILPDVEAVDIPDGLFRKIFFGKTYGFKKHKDKKKADERNEISSPEPQSFARSSSYNSAVDPSGSNSFPFRRQHSDNNNQGNLSRRGYSGRLSRATESQIDNDRYYFSHTQRGYMLIIVNEFFYNQSSRDGASRDLSNMRAIARKFGFRILNYKQERDVNKRDMMYWLGRARATDHSDCDCFAFVISTHGYEQKNARAGGREDHALVCADDQMVFTSTITDMFNDDNCPSLKDKPKFFFIQACRGKFLLLSSTFLTQPLSKFTHHQPYFRKNFLRSQFN